MAVRVLEALSDPDVRRQLRGKIPKEAYAGLPTDCKTAKYPSVLLKAFDKDEAYCNLGILTEMLLREPGTNLVDYSHIVDNCKDIFEVDLTPNVAKAKSTFGYLESVNKTRDLLRAAYSGVVPEVNETLAHPSTSVIGHPDILIPNAIFEVKTTGMLKQNWPKFLMQVFCYAALYPQASHVHVVLPLQECVWTWDVKNNWPKREKFLEVLGKFHPPISTAPKSPEEDLKEELETIFAPALFEAFPIGMHIPKKKSMVATLQSVPNFDRPYQLFFNSKTTRVAVNDLDIAQASEIIANSNAKIFIHTPYLLNLCLEPEEKGNYVVECLRKHLEVASALGARGVVVHVGKSVKLPVPEALENMRTNIMQSLDGVGSSECPLLLETPAGQGTELLTTHEDFMNFVDSIQLPNFGICIDTCHVFAAGIEPNKYLADTLKNPSWAKQLKLVHFNDSKAKCGDCVDRHAELGTGMISKAHLFECAAMAHAHRIPMVVE